ncbi:MAG: hypothetical protein ACREUW_15170 [Burkholderiales bacterium]
MNCWRTIGAALLCGGMLLDAMAADTPWVMLGRKAVGRIQHMTQSETNGGPGYELATVVLKGDADKVFATALKAVQASTQVRLTLQDPQQRILEFTNGTQTAGLRVASVDGQLIQLLITSVRLPGQTSATSLVLAGVMRVCKDMGVECTLAQ